LQNIKETDLAYFAGMLDGEGHVSIFRHRKKRCSKRGYEIEPIMTLSNMNQENVFALQKLLNMGRVYLAKHKRKCGVIIVAHLIFSVNDQRIIIPQILPYVMQKKERLEIIKAFLDYRSTTNKTFDERELKYYQFEKQFEQATYRAKPWMLITPISAKGRAYKHVEVPEIIKHLVIPQTF
jgi:hypothetical protein